MQFCPFQHSVPPLLQLVANSSTLPLDRVSKLSLPWIVYCIPLPSSPSPSTLHGLYLKLVESSTTYLSSLPDSSLPPLGPKRDSHNVFLTSSHLFLVPRRDRLVAIPRVASIDQGKLSLGGGWEDVQGADKEMRLSVNGLSVLGYWYVGSKEEEEDLRRHGVERTLKECCYVNEEY
jgi:hypothetical protein